MEPEEVEVELPDFLFLGEIVESHATSVSLSVKWVKVGVITKVAYVLKLL